jgi:hypothetical protein
MAFYRVMLDAEDGVYCQKDHFLTEDDAWAWCYEHDDYSEDRNLFVESYQYGY